jgi:hypothetical protein
MKFYTYRHFIYITVRDDEHKKQLQLYYKITEEDHEEISKDWLKKLLILIHPVETSDPNNIETMHKEHDTPRHNKMKKIGEFQDLSSASGKIASVSPDRGGDDEVEEINNK